MIHSVLETFELRVEAGTFTDSEIIVMLGENGRLISLKLFHRIRTLLYITTGVNWSTGQ